MFIDIDNDSFSCDSPDEFEKQIGILLDMESAEAWISENGGSDDLPCLSVLVNDGEYVINYFGEDGSNYVSAGLEGDEREVSFCNGRYEVSGCQIILREDAKTAMLHFYKTHETSDEINWEEL